MNEEVINKGYGFAVYPSVKIKDFKINKKGLKYLSFVEEILYGDFIRLLSRKPIKIGRIKYFKVRCRNAKGYLPVNQIQSARIMEINFVDVGQGDGCHLVTPEDEHFIIDAGESDNMYRFLRWRFNLTKEHSSFPKFTAIITHPDRDHYRGFGKLLKPPKNIKSAINFDVIYHNGIVEEKGSSIESLGNIIEDNKGKKYVSNLCFDTKQFENRIKNNPEAGPYMKMLGGKNLKIEGLFFDGKVTKLIYDKGDTLIEVLGPIVKEVDGNKTYPIFNNDKGKTKNGHSVVLKLIIGKLRVLLGGDLNSFAEDYIFKEITKTDVEKCKEIIKDPSSSAKEIKEASKEIKDAVKELRKKYGVDIAKSCHHGSPDFTNEFLDALNPLATIISSGDNESHCHPRPDTLGTLGKFSRGNRSLIFSTELARSTKEFLDLSKLPFSKRKERLVTVYGMITVRTNGNKTLIAQKLEKPRGSSNWDIHKLVWNKDKGEFEYKSKYNK